MVEGFSPMGSLRDVKALKIVVTMLLLALWLPATSHALLEQVEWIHTAHADAHDASDTDNDNNHDVADGLCRVASTDVQVPRAVVGVHRFFAHARRVV